MWRQKELTPTGNAAIVIIQAGSRFRKEGNRLPAMGWWRVIGIHPLLITVIQMTITGLSLNRNATSTTINVSLPKEDKTSETRIQDHVSMRLDHRMTHGVHSSGLLFNLTEANPHREMDSSKDPDPITGEADRPYKKEEETNPTLSCLEKRLSRNAFHAKKSQS